MNKLELRNLDVELTGVTQDSGDLLVSGYVNQTGQWSQLLGREQRFKERIMPGTFQKALDKGNDVAFLAEHDSAKLLASTKNGSLTLREDDKGLFMEARISPTSWGKDYHTLITDGLLTNMSFGMVVGQDKWEKNNDGTLNRSISDIQLAEVSVVRNPAYVQSNIQARSIEMIDEPTINLLEEPKMSKEKQLKELRAQMEALETEVRSEVAQEVKEVRAVEVESKDAMELRGVEQFLRGEMHTEEVRALTTGTQSITVPTVLSNVIVEKLVEEAAIFGRARSFQTVAGTLEVLREQNIGDASFVGENENLNFADFSMDKVILEQRRAGTAIELTEQLINDSGINIVNYATGIMTKRLARKLDEQALIGNKANKSFEGILTSAVAERVAAHAVADINEDLLLDLTLAMHPDYLDGAVFVVNRATFNKIAKLKDNDGRYLMVKDVVSDKPAYKIFGHQIVIQDKMPAAAVAGDITVAFVNFAQAAATMTKKGASMKRVTDTASALKGTQVLVLDVYCDFKIINEDAIKFLELA
jgi:HK97 family phage major capsid protein/HK97 family phage prohead protease